MKEQRLWVYPKVAIKLRDSWAVYLNKVSTWNTDVAGNLHVFDEYGRPFTSQVSGGWNRVSADPHEIDQIVKLLEQAMAKEVADRLRSKVMQQKKAKPYKQVPAPAKAYKVMSDDDEDDGDEMEDDEEVDA